MTAALAKGAPAPHEASRTANLTNRRHFRNRFGDGVNSRMAKKVQSKKPTTETEKVAKLAKPGKYVYYFGDGKADGDRTMKDLLGGKGSGLAEMTNAKLPVPAGFTISTPVCTIYYKEGGKIPASIDKEMIDNLRKLEKSAGRKLGDTKKPLLVSVRSGAKFSMPGMMDTILNLGLNDETVESLKQETGNGRFAADSYRRFIQMFGNVVLEIPKDVFEHELDAVKKSRGVKADTDLDEAALREVIARYKKVVKNKTGKDFPQDPIEQLKGSRNAVFRSWQNPRAKEYRRIYDIPDYIGTAVNVQQMVFGNTGDRSATGVGFTRSPATGAKEFYGEFLINAQGEDVVSGVRTPQQIKELEKVLPKAYKQLREITTRLEKHYKDVQDFEFTIQDEKLYMLQTRSGKRTGYAAVVIATDLADEKIVSPKEALLLVDPGSAVAAAVAGIRSGRVGEGPDSRQGASGVAWRGLGPGRLHRGRCGRMDASGQAGDPRPQGNGSRRHPRHARRAGHPDGDGRHDVARRGRRPPDGQAVDRRRRLADDFREGQAVHRRRQGRQGRGVRLVRRPQGGNQAREDGVEAERDSPGRQRPARREEVGYLPALQQDSRVGRQGAPPRHPRERGPAGSGRAGLRVRRARHRPVPHRAHVLRRRSAADRAAHDPRGQRHRSEESGARAAAAAARGLLRRVQGDEGAAGHHPHDRSAAARVPAEARRPDGRGRQARGDQRRQARARREAEAARARRTASRVQSHARPSRRAPRHHVSRDHRDADARHHRGGDSAEEGRAEGRPGDHDSAGRPREGAEGSEGRSSIAWRPRR